MVRGFLRAHGELVFVFVLGVVAQGELWPDRPWAEDRVVLAPIALGMTAALLLRLRAPVLALALEIAGLVAMSLANPAPGNDPMGVVLIALVAVYSAGAHTRGRAFAAALALVLAAGASPSSRTARAST